MTHNQSKKNTTGGFGLIEIMVAVSIFSIVMVISAGSLLTIIDSNRKAQAIQIVVNNLNFAVDSMVRGMRVGNAYHCGSGGGSPATPRNCSSGDDYIAFEASDGDGADPNDQVVYRLNNGNIERSVNSGGSFVPVTAPEVEVEELMFYVTGAEDDDNLQPRVIIVIRGTAGAGRTETTFNLETMVSQRGTDG